MGTATSRSEPTLRLAVPGDGAAISSIHHLGWTRDYRGLLPEAYLDSLSHAACTDRWVSALRDGTPLRTRVAELDHRVVGFVASGDSLDPDATAAGEIWDLWVADAARSSGVGAALLEIALDDLAERHAAALVWVLSGNVRAQSFYSRSGAVRDGRSRTTPVLGGSMTDVRLLWDLRGRVPAAGNLSG